MKNDIRELVRFAREDKLTLIPRTAGTSLAGQVVGSGIVVDVSKHMTEILEINEKERWVRVQPGVVLDELNIALKSTGLFFSPETSTSNRSMIGGMIGNNSCGLRSLVYGTTRDHTLSVRAVLSDGIRGRIWFPRSGRIFVKSLITGETGRQYLPGAPRISS